MNRRLCATVAQMMLLTAPLVCADDFPTAEQLRGGQKSSPVPETVAPFEAAPVVRTPDQIPLGPRPGSSAKADDQATDSRADGLSPGTVIGALSVVIVVILGLAKLFVRQSPYVVSGLPQEAVEVLGRRTVDPRNSVYVVQVGSKILLLGSSANGLAPLSEITDPIEVAALTNLCRAEQSSRPELKNWLTGLFGRQEKPADDRPFTERFGGRLSQDAPAPPLASRTEARRVA